MVKRGGREEAEDVAEGGEGEDVVDAGGGEGEVELRC